MRQTITNLRLVATGLAELSDENMKKVMDEMFRAIKELDERLEACEKKVRSGY